MPNRERRKPRDSDRLKEPMVADKDGVCKDNVPARPAKSSKKPTGGSCKEDRAESVDIVKTYLRDIRKSTLLTFEDEQELGKRVAEGDLAPFVRLVGPNRDRAQRSAISCAVGPRRRFRCGARHPLVIAGSVRVELAVAVVIIGRPACACGWT